MTRALFFFMLAAVLVACGGAYTHAAIETGVAQAAQLSQLETSAALAQSTPALQETPTAAVDPNFSWSGNWRSSDSTFYVAQTGDRVVADIYDDSLHMIFEGTLYHNNTIVVGFARYDLGSGNFFPMPFQWRLNPQDSTQFSGSFIYPGILPPLSFCASRDYGVVIDPCLWP